MNQASYQHRVQSSLHAAAASPHFYRRKISVLFGLLLAWAFVLPVLALLLVGLGVYGELVLAWPWGLGWVLAFAALGLMALVAYSLYSPVLAVDGLKVEPQEAPELLRMLKKMQEKLNAPALNGVVLTADFSLHMRAEGHWALGGKARNVLYVGLPYLVSASPERMLALIAQEYAHSRASGPFSALTIYRLRRHWAAEVLDDKGLVCAAQRKGLAGLFQNMKLRFVAASFALARQEEEAADLAAAKLYGRERMAEALLENAIVAEHVRHEHWRQYWQQASKRSKPAQGPYAWLTAWNIKPPKARAVEERFAELMRQEPSLQSTLPPTRLRVQALGRSMELPPPSSRHAGVLLGKALARAVKHWDEQWWALNAERWQVLHLQYQQEGSTIAQLEAQVDDLGVADLERLAQLYKRHLRENEAEMIYRRVRELDAYSPHALWQQIEFLMERNDDNALLSLAEMVDRHPEHQHRAIILALGLLEKLPQTVEVQDLRKTWQERLAHYELQEDLWAAHLQRDPVMAHTQPTQLGPWQAEDLAITAQRIPSILRLWVLEKNTVAEHWRKAYVLVVEQRSLDAVNTADIAAEYGWLGRVFCVALHELPHLQPLKTQASLGEPSYAGQAQKFKPILANRLQTGPVPLSLY